MSPNGCLPCVQACTGKGEGAHKGRPYGVSGRIGPRQLGQPARRILKCESTGRAVAWRESAVQVGDCSPPLAPVSASAHFGLEGTADLIVDYGLLALIGILVVGGAAVSAWLAAGSPSDDDDDDEAGTWEHGAAAAMDEPAGSSHPTVPAASDHTAQSR